MNQRVADELIWRYVDLLHQGTESAERCLSLFPGHRGQLEPLLALARRLSPSLPVVEPSPAFARRLKQDLLVAAAAHRHAPARPAPANELWWRAAAVGSAVSVVAAVAVMWRSSHSHASPVAAPAGSSEHAA